MHPAHQGEPVAKLRDGELIKMANKAAPHPTRDNDMLYIAMGRLVEEYYTHADPAEAERLREGIAKHWKVVCDQRAEIESLRAQLAKVVRSGALTTPEHEALEAECCALSANAEPSAPAERETVEVEAYLVRDKEVPRHRGVRLFVDPSCYDANTETLPLMTVAQHERIVAALERKP